GKPQAPSGHHWILWGLMVVLVMTGIAGAAWWWKGRHVYSRWRDRRLLEQCQTWVREGRLADAAVGTRRLLDKDPYNVKAATIQADLAEKVGMRDAVLWRSRVARIEPDKLEHLVAWAQTALRFGDVLSARAAL